MYNKTVSGVAFPEPVRLPQHSRDKESTNTEAGNEITSQMHLEIWKQKVKAICKLIRESWSA